MRTPRQKRTQIETDDVPVLKIPVAVSQIHRTRWLPTPDQWLAELTSPELLAEIGQPALPKLLAYRPGSDFVNTVTIVNEFDSDPNLIALCSLVSQSKDLNRHLQQYYSEYVKGQTVPFYFPFSGVVKLPELLPLLATWVESYQPDRADTQMDQWVKFSAFLHQKGKVIKQLFARDRNHHPAGFMLNPITEPDLPNLFPNHFKLAMSNGEPIITKNPNCGACNK